MEGLFKNYDAYDFMEMCDKISDIANAMEEINSLYYMIRRGTKISTAELTESLDIIFNPLTCYRRLLQEEYNKMVDIDRNNRTVNFELMANSNDSPRVERLKMLKECILECIEKYGHEGFIDMLWKVEKFINDEYDKNEKKNPPQNEE